MECKLQDEELVLTLFIVWGLDKQNSNYTYHLMTREKRHGIDKGLLDTS